MLICITHSRDQPALKSTLFQLQVYANMRPLKVSKLEMCIQLFLACRSRQASIVLERYFRFEVSLLFGSADPELASFLTLDSFY